LHALIDVANILADEADILALPTLVDVDSVRIVVESPRGSAVKLRCNPSQGVVTTQGVVTAGAGSVCPAAVALEVRNRNSQLGVLALAGMCVRALVHRHPVARSFDGVDFRLELRHPRELDALFLPDSPDVSEDALHQFRQSIKCSVQRRELFRRRRTRRLSGRPVSESWGHTSE